MKRKGKEKEKDMPRLPKSPGKYIKNA